jgi:hypothetical protein
MQRFALGSLTMNIFRETDVIGLKIRRADVAKHAPRLIAIFIHTKHNESLIKLPAHQLPTHCIQLMRRVAREKAPTQREPTYPIAKKSSSKPTKQDPIPKHSSEIQSLAQSLLQKQKVLATTTPISTSHVVPTVASQDAAQKGEQDVAKPPPCHPLQIIKKQSPDVSNMLRFVQRALIKALHYPTERSHISANHHTGPWWCFISETGDRPYPLRLLTSGDGYHQDMGGKEVLVDTIRYSITRQLAHTFKRQCLIQIVGVLPEKFAYRDNRQYAKQEAFSVSPKQPFVQLSQTSLVLVQRFPHPHAWKSGGKLAGPQASGNKASMNKKQPQQQLPLNDMLTEQELIDRMMAQQEENDKRQLKEMQEDEDQNMPRPPPKHYICHYCQQKGHWQSDCLVLHTDMNRADWAGRSQSTLQPQQDDAAFSMAPSARKSDPTSMLQVRQALRRLPHGIPRFLLQEVSVENIHEAQYRTADDKLLKYRAGITLDASHSSVPNRISSTANLRGRTATNMTHTCDFCALVPFLAPHLVPRPTTVVVALPKRGNPKFGYRDAKRKRADEIKVAEITWSTTECCNAPVCSSCKARFNFEHQQHLGQWTTCAKCQHVYNHAPEESLIT